MKQVMKVEMFGMKLVVKFFPGTDYPYRVYDALKHPTHLDSFESFSEAWHFIEEELYER